MVKYYQAMIGTSTWEGSTLEHLANEIIFFNDDKPKCPQVDKLVVYENEQELECGIAQFNEFLLEKWANIEADRRYGSAW